MIRVGLVDDHPTVRASLGPVAASDGGPDQPFPGSELNSRNPISPGE